MGVPVDEAGDQSPAAQVVFCRARAGELVTFVTDGKNPAATDQHMTNSEVLRCEDSGIGEKL